MSSNPINPYQDSGSQVRQLSFFGGVYGRYVELDAGVYKTTTGRPQPVETIASWYPVISCCTKRAPRLNDRKIHAQSTWLTKVLEGDNEQTLTPVGSPPCNWLVCVGYNRLYTGYLMGELGFMVMITYDNYNIL